MSKTNRTAAIVIHVTPELKARLQQLADDAGLKLSPFVFQVLRAVSQPKAMTIKAPPKFHMGEDAS